MSDQQEAQRLARALHPDHGVDITPDGPGRWAVWLDSACPAAVIAADTREAAWAEVVRYLRVRVEQRLVAVGGERARLAGALGVPDWRPWHTITEAMWAARPEGTVLALTPWGALRVESSAQHGPHRGIFIAPAERVCIVDPVTLVPRAWVEAAEGESDP